MPMWVGGSLRTCSFLFFGLGAAAFKVDRPRRGNVCLEDQAKACSPTDQPVRKFKHSLGINMTMKKNYFPDRVIFEYPYSSTIMEWRLHLVVHAAAVTTHAMPHVQQQLARDLEVERAAMGQRCQPQSFGEVQRGNPQPRRWLDFLRTAALLLYSRRTWGYCSWRSEKRWSSGAPVHVLHGN